MQASALPFLNIAFAENLKGKGINMSQYSKEECKLKDTEYCRILGKPACEQCHLLDGDETDEKKAMKDIDTVKLLLPEGGLCSLYEAAECQLCKGDKKKREYYAISDMGHVEPKTTKRNAIGMKVKTPIGSIISVQISCCKQCRKNHLIPIYMPLACMISLVILSLLIMSFTPLGGAISKANELLPLVIFFIAMPVGWFIGSLAANAIIKNNKNETIYELEEVPLIKQMLDKGWFFISSEGKGAKLIFVKNKLKNGWFL